MHWPPFLPKVHNARTAGIVGVTWLGDAMRADSMSIFHYLSPLPKDSPHAGNGGLTSAVGGLIGRL
jgi:hypothetical protein